MVRDAEVAASLQDWETFRSTAGVGMANFRQEKSWRRQSIILEADPPLHTRTHKVLLRVLAPSTLNALNLVRTLLSAGLDTTIYLLTAALSCLTQSGGI